MGGRAEDLEQLRTLAATRMSDASIAMVMGKSARWVEKERAALAAPESVAPVVAPPAVRLDGLRPVEFDRAKVAVRTLAAVEAIAPSRPVAIPPRPAPVAPPVRPPPPALPVQAAEQPAAPIRLRAVDFEARPQPARALPVNPVLPIARPEPEREPRGGLTRLREPTPALLRYAGWFLAAGWPAAEVAELFDTAPEALEHRKVRA